VNCCNCGEEIREASGYICGKCLVEIQGFKSRWETPEQWEKRTGEAWPDDWYVWIRTPYTAEELDVDVEYLYAWNAYPYGYVKKMGSVEGKTVVCLTTSAPPPDDWQPEGE
jgi:hypothetical protein